MSERNILNLGKSIFGVFFITGNMCLFGYLITKEEDFAIGGLFLLIVGSALNLLIILILLLSAVFIPSRSDACLKAIGILMINIPIAIIYALIGLNLN
ncbi:hypothetical protein [Chryseobacterium artocarpi]|uniref:hypothetical protein n=1 Tax=Chryseobacterium artocarpi TaxID=1414727 RepID=UPI003F37A0F6